MFKMFILFKTSLFHRAYSYLVFVGYNQIGLIFFYPHLIIINILTSCLT